MTNITTVTVTFGHGIKREEYGPTKKAEVSITASVAENEDGSVVLHQIGHMALTKVADLLNAPKPADASTATEIVAGQLAASVAAGEKPPARRGRPPKAEEPAASQPATGAEPAAGALAPTTSTAEDATAPTDDWAAPAEQEITDQELLSSTSKRAGELGARDPIVKLIATFATRTEGAPFKVQEIPQAQRRDYLTKLAALKA